ncbi:MAG: ATP-binding protein [Desulfobacterales bacterium]|nr:ATP-binding protein [Desulfobacterales bacterium]
MEKRKLKELIVTHTKSVLKKHKLIKRQVLNLPRIIEKKETVIITGVRRCGKSSLMIIILNDLIDQKKVSADNILYINFEDERFVEFTHEDFETLYECYLKLNNPQGKKYLFFDEIQNIPYWEKWIHRMYEFEEVKIFITGSNATLLSGEIATALTGRNISLSLFPFSFKELLTRHEISIDQNMIYDREYRVLLKRYFEVYMKFGGFPEVLISKDDSLLQHYFKDILYRDIVARYSIKNIKQIKELSLYLANNIGNLCSYRNLARTISANSTSTIKNFLDHLENAYLFFRLGLFDYSLKKQMYNPSKIYCVDTALARSIAFRFTRDTGRICENIVFLELIRLGKEIYYWKSTQHDEIDFLIKEGLKVVEIIQVCSDVSQKETQNKKIRAALQAASEFGLNKATIITGDFSGELMKDGVEITFIPLWQWLIA